MYASEYLSMKWEVDAHPELCALRVQLRQCRQMWISCSGASLSERHGNLRRELQARVHSSVEWYSPSLSSCGRQDISIMVNVANTEDPRRCCTGDKHGTWFGGYILISFRANLPILSFVYKWRFFIISLKKSSYITCVHTFSVRFQISLPAFMVSGFPDASDVTNTLVFYPGYKTYNVERAFVFTIETPWLPVKANKWVVGSFCVASGGGK